MVSIRDMEERTQESGESNASRIVGIVFKKGYPIDALLNDVVVELEAQGAKLAGVIQTAGLEPGCDVLGVKLRSLAGDWDMPILQNRGREARGCRLDYGSIAEVTARISNNIPADTDFVFLNRFGRAEAEGNGFRQILQKCLESDFPAIIGVREDYLEDWTVFHGGLATQLPPDRHAILGYCRRQMASRSSGQYGWKSPVG